MIYARHLTVNVQVRWIAQWLRERKQTSVRDRGYQTTSGGERPGSNEPWTTKAFDQLFSCSSHNQCVRHHSPHSPLGCSPPRAPYRCSPLRTHSRSRQFSSPSASEGQEDSVRRTPTSSSQRYRTRLFSRAYPTNHSSSIPFCLIAPRMQLPFTVSHLSHSRKERRICPVIHPERLTTSTERQAIIGWLM